MGIYLNPGNESFQMSVRSRIYVDKTGLIEYTNSVLESEQRNICVSRPRRFGKSMAANMLTAYYSKGCDSREIFRNLAIGKQKDYKEHLNQYNVIFLNIQRFLSRAGGTENVVSYLQEEVLKELKEQYSGLIYPEERMLTVALESIWEKTKDGFVFIIDEWDCIFREKQHAVDVQTKYLDFLRDLLKDQPYVKLAYMTGILPIKKYGTHSALNMFDEFSMTDPKRLAGYAGFTESEVAVLCKKYKMDFEETQKWYDGYRFLQNMHIYSPKSVIDAMLNGRFDSYWTETETYESLKMYIEMNFDGLKDAIIIMLSGGRYPINTRKFQNDMTTFKSRDDVLTLLVHLGYLAYDVNSQEVFIPNQEVEGEFKNAIEDSRWTEIVRTLESSDRLLSATLNQNEDMVAEAINNVHMETTSILNYNNENALSCVITLAYYSAKKEYVLVRECPSGYGFADIVFLPRKYSSNPAFIVELKWDKTAEGAIAQIKDKHYSKSLETYEGEILLVGINYDRKNKKHQCVIERMEKSSN